MSTTGILMRISYICLGLVLGTILGLLIGERTKG